MQGNTEPSSAGAPTTPANSARPQRLVALIPGLSGSVARWAPLKERLSAESGFRPGEAFWLDFDHHTTILSRGTVDSVARRLNNLITAKWVETGGFGDVVLVGHSMGGLIARQAYLLAAGAVPGEHAADWSQRVSRIVLLASLNRGADLRKAPFLGLVTWLARLIPFLPHFRGMDAVRGSNFLTNLRINWIRHFGAIAADQRAHKSWPDGRPVRPPLVVQLLGDKDGLVSPEDSKDVLVFPSGHDLMVPDADHRDLYQFDTAPDPKLRYAVLRRGFLDAFPDDPPAESPVQRVVFLLHGIRASNVDAWVRELGRRIEERDPGRTIVKHPTYGYFTAARFALPSVRRKNISVFQDWYTEALAEYPTAEFDIIAHSNGTYILGQSLTQTPSMRFRYVALAGSVLPTDFPWGTLRADDQVGVVRNDRANRDWPVALLCNALRGLRMRDVGPGGFAGFLGDATHELAYYPGDHGAALNSDYQNFLVDFIFSGNVEEPPGLVVTPGYFRPLSNVMPYLAVLLAVATVVGLGWFILQGGAFHLDRAVVSALVISATYVILDVI
jgi:alpha-beta hydrolase superfamily lysophospholipase